MSEGVSNNNIKINKPKVYQIDFDKVKTTEDVIIILKGLDIRMSEDAYCFELLKDYLKQI